MALRVLPLALLLLVEHGGAVLAPRHLRHAPGGEDTIEENLEKLEALFAKADETLVLKNQTQASSEKSVAPISPPTDKQNPKCDQVCTNGNEGYRSKCALKCAKMQKKLCVKEFSCHRACANHIKQIPDDPQCEKLCLHVQEEVCLLGWQAPEDVVSPHHDDKLPPAIEATPAPRIYKGTTIICNLYPASYEFEILALPNAGAKDGPKLTTLGYKQCDKVPLKTLQALGVRAKGNLAGTSRPIDKVPSMMLFGQHAHGNHQIEFNRYFAKGNGAMLCNGFPVWDTKTDGLPVQFLRGGYDGKELAKLRYKECVPTALVNGDVVSARIKENDAGEYKVVGSPSAIVLGKAGTSTAVAFEAWTDNEVSF